jgi:hypothetical protein
MKIKKFNSSKMENEIFLNEHKIEKYEKKEIGLDLTKNLDEKIILEKITNSLKYVIF